MLAPMDPQQIALVRTSFAAASEPPGELTGAFYRRLFEAAPELSERFTTDPAVQEQKLAAELRAIVDLLDHVDELIPRTRALGSRHGGYGARPAHYELVGVALLGAFAEVLGTGFTPEVAEAWRYAYNLVAEAMQQGHAWVGVEASLP